MLMPSYGSLSLSPGSLHQGRQRSHLLFKHNDVSANARRSCSSLQPGSYMNLLGSVCAIPAHNSPILGTPVQAPALHTGNFLYCLDQR